MSNVILFVLGLLVLGLGVQCLYLMRRASEAEKQMAVAVNQLQQEQSERAKAQHELGNIRNEKDGLGKDLVEAKTRHEAEQKRSEELKRQVEQLPTAFTAQMEVISRKLVDQGTDKLSKENKEQVAREFENMGTLIKDFKAKLESLEKEGQESNVALKTTIENLDGGTKELTRALRGQSKLQGNWGEQVLEQIFDNVGFREGEHYTKAPQLEDPLTGAVYYPDYVIYVPAEQPGGEKRYLLLDSKATVKGSDELNQSKSNDEKKVARDKIRKSIEQHIIGLAGKNYPAMFGDKAPEYVIMFVPTPGMIDLACEESPTLYRDALSKKVCLVDSRTVMPVLMLVRNMWQLSTQHSAAKGIIELAGSLFTSIELFKEEMSILGKSLATAMTTYESANRRIVSGGQGSLLTYTTRLRELGIEGRNTLRGNGRRGRPRKNGGAEVVDVQMPGMDEAAEDCEETTEQDGAEQK